MIIGIDGNEANVRQKVGIGQYAYNLLSGLSKNKKDKFIIYLKNPPRADMPAASAFWLYKLIGPKFMWTRIGLPINLLLSKDKPDIFFSPTHYAPIYSPCPTVISVMDLSFIFFPELFRKKDLYQLTAWTKRSVEKAAKILTISHYSKKTIINQYKLNEDKVVVTYPGYNNKLFNYQSDDENYIKLKLNKFGITGKYILFVGTLQPRKNLVRLISAFHNVLKFYKNLQLVIIGKKGWLYNEILKNAENLKKQRKIIIIESVQMHDLPFFYKGAQCLTLPSLYEGFGLPVVEAMACGCPVVASNVSSLPEVAGDAGVMVDPYRVDSIAKGITDVLSNDNFRNLLIRKGLDRIKKFSWSKCAQETIEVLKTV